MTITNQHQLIKNSCYPEHVTQIQLNCDENVAYVMPPMKMSSCRISFGFMACVMWQITEFFFNVDEIMTRNHPFFYISILLCRKHSRGRNHIAATTQREKFIENIHLIFLD